VCGANDEQSEQPPIGALRQRQRVDMGLDQVLVLIAQHDQAIGDQGRAVWQDPDQNTRVRCLIQQRIEMCAKQSRTAPTGRLPA